jgi:hypothetical protein
MKKLLQFVSLTILTQGVVATNQIVLLPIQIRIWGHASTAYWYTTFAIASIVSIADFGLRTAGHADLIRCAQNPSDSEAKTKFRHLWTWIRILVCSATVPLLVLEAICGGYHVWHSALTIGITCETLLCIRVMYLDSLEFYRQAEAGYLLLAAARLCLSIGALVFFHASPRTLAWIWFLTGAFALAHQSRLCSRIGLLGLFEQIPPGLSFRTLAIARHTMADPVANWTRNNVPVLVLSAIAQPVALITYVALRAVFGGARQMASQLSRYASVRYVHARDSAAAQQIVPLCMLSVGFAASVLAYIVLADNFRLASLWLKSSPGIYRAISTIFALGAPLYAYQIMQALMLRDGKIQAIAKRQYLYIGCLATFSVIALLTKSVLLWLVLILVAEVGISVSFIFQRHVQALASFSVRPFLALLVSTVLAATLALLIRFAHLAPVEQITAPAIAATLALLSLWTLVSAAVYLHVAREYLPASVLNTLLTLVRAQRRSQND